MHGLYESLRQTHAYLFSHAPIFVSRDNVTAMERVVTAVEAVALRSDQWQTTNFRTPGGGFATVSCPVH